MSTDETLYTYYQIDLEGMSVDWNTTICESLDDVRDVIQFLYTHFDDPECNGRAIITGIGMTREAYAKWKEEYIKE
jgi:hypothetical protein